MMTESVLMSSDALEDTPPRDALVIRIAGGIQVCVPGNLRLLTPYVLMEQEDWFEDEMAFVRAFARPGMSMVDIGANHGVYTLTVARALAGQGRVTAYEPTPMTARFLRASVAVNGLGNVIDVVEAGVSDAARTATFFVGANSELNSLHGDESGAGQRIEVPLVTLDEEATKHDWRDVDFVKLDAEGEEINVLKGGSQFFRKNSPLVLFELKHGGHVNRHLIAAFNEIGYRTYRLVPGLNKLVPHGPNDGIDGYLLNLFACKDDRALEVAEHGLMISRPSRSLREEAAGIDVLDDLSRRSFSDGFLARWRDRLASGAVEPALRRTLALQCLAERSDHPSSLRFAALRGSFLTARTLVTRQAQKDADAPISIAPHMLLARAGRMIGARGQAIQAVHRALHLLETGKARLQDPFLPPLPSADARVSRGLQREWLNIALLEPLVLWSRYSGYFGKENSLQPLQAALKSPFRTQEMERRYHLLRWHDAGYCPTLSAELRMEAPGHLNADLWRRLVAARSAPGSVPSSHSL